MTEEQVRLYLRFGMLCGMAQRAGFDMREVEDELNKCGYPIKSIPEEVAERLSTNLGRMLVDAGELAPDEDPLDTLKIDCVEQDPQRQ